MIDRKQFRILAQRWKRSLLLAGGSSLIGVLIIAFPAQPAAYAQSVPNGQLIFKQRCSTCHQISAGQKAGIGPNLSGIVGRKAGGTTFNYSPALKKSGLSWTRPNLDKYLAGPMKLVPGTRMTVSLSDPAQRAAVVSYLAQTN
ncbi:MAG: cytochrome C [Alphaproteobacteria bacterium HGW-Alphaproteobacteria-13]|nr:MAG: cytochrome C [Alphaproteobacteria bacterium HGW-Alphaproteobacteria-13]